MPSSILNSDDGVISGTSGLKSSGGDDGVLVFQSKGTETARINTDKQIVAAAGTASLPALTTTGDVNTGIFFPAADTAAIATNGSERVRVSSTGSVGVGVTPSSWNTLTPIEMASGSLSAFSTNQLYLSQNAYYNSAWKYKTSAAAGQYYQTAGLHVWYTAASGTADNNITFSERARITSDGNLLVGKENTALGTAGFSLLSGSSLDVTVSADKCIRANRLSNDGNLVEFLQDTTVEGTISVSGTTVSYNGGHLSRWAQMLTKPDLLKGTVMSNLDEMNVYIAPTTYWTEEDELPEGVNVGDVKVETHEVQNEQLNKVKVSDVEGDANVAGVFVNWTYDEAHQVDEINMAMTGDMIIRIAQGVTVARGDLLMSAGDGTAKPQGDDIVRSKTIAKVTSTHVTCTYDDGSYCVPCVLMAC